MENGLSRDRDEMAPVEAGRAEPARTGPHLVGKASTFPENSVGAALLLGLTLGLLTLSDCQAAPPAEAQPTVDVPAAWKKPPGDGYRWFRCLVKIPDQWRGRSLKLVVEAVDDAREFYFAGTRIGGLGQFPPQYRSGLGQDREFEIPPALVRGNEYQWLAIRVYHEGGRTSFNVAAPAIFGGDQGLHLQGKWQYLAGDDPRWQLRPAPDKTAAIRYEQTRLSAEIRRLLLKLPDEEGPLPVSESLKRFHVAEDLQLEVVLAEPIIGQPLSIKFDERGRLWLVQYLQYPNPAGLKMLSRDQHLRTVYDKIPPAPPHHFPGKDKITIHEDSDGDGVYDRHKTFVDGLSIVSSMALAQDGVWVLNPPYLLFYPDRDHDDRPDGDPVVHLAGFGLEDSHSVVNSLRWGPDGWLYAAQGSTVTGNVTYPGRSDPPVRSMGQLIWRYHPSQRKYEIFAEGGGNTFGVEFDSQGRVFSGHNGGDTRGFHYVQGGYYRKGFGKHGELSNPYTFGFFEAMRHHPAQRFTHTFVIYEGGSLPDRYQGRLLGAAPLQSHIIMSEISADRSSLMTRDVGLPLTSDDPWFRPVDIQVGPDGAVYVVDFYEQRIDHASHYQGRVHRESGRIYRLRAKDAAPQATNLSGESVAELVDLLSHPNKWVRQTAVRLLAERNDTSARHSLLAKLQQSQQPHAVDHLWALYRLGGLTPDTAAALLKHHDVPVRAWTVRLLCEQETPEATARILAGLAETEPSAEVRSQLASSARRLAARPCLAIVRRLLDHSSDVEDIHLPLLLWWAIEDKMKSSQADVIALFDEPELWDARLVREFLLERVMRRLASTAKQSDLVVCAALLQKAPSDQHVQALMKGFEAASAGRSLLALPAALTEALAKVGGGSLSLRVRQGDRSAIDEALHALSDSSLALKTRLELAHLFAQVKEPSCVDVLLKISLQEGNDLSLRAAALNSLQAYPAAEIGRQVARMYPRLPAEVQEVAQSLLVSRPGWSKIFLEAVDAGAIEKKQVAQRMVHRMLLLGDQELARQVARHWPQIGGNDDSSWRTEVAELTRIIQAGSGNPYSGKNLFEEHCAKCHTLFARGGKIGPDLTSYKRDDLRYMLMNVVNPSLEIREGFENHVLHLSDGRTLSGFVVDSDQGTVVLRSVDGQSSVVSRGDIEEMAAIKRSLMPERILASFTPQQIRDLFAYLRSTQPLP